MIGIYKIVNLINNKVYVGKSVNITRRFSRHRLYLNLNKHVNTHLQKAWNKYGSKAFAFYALELCDESQLNNREIYWISKLNSTDSKYGYNKKSGGEGGKLTPDALARMCRGLKGKKLSAEHRKAISIGNLGHKVSDITKDKMSKASQGKPKSSEHKQSISQTLSGRALSLETRQKMSIVRKGIKQKQITCPICFKVGGTAIYRWHFNECRFK